MKTLKNLLETLKGLISEAAQNLQGYDNAQLIPVPVRNSERNFPNSNNQQ